MAGIGGNVREEIRAKVDEALTEDPVVKWIAESWKQLCLGLILFGSVMYIRSSYIQNNIETTTASADAFARVRQAYESYISLKEAPDTKPEDLEKKKRALDEVLKVLGDTKAPYTDFSLFYQSALDLNQPIELADPKNITQRLVTEVSLLKRARLLIDDSSRYLEGLNMLEKLSREGKFVSAESTIAYGSIASSKEEKEKAQGLITSFIQQNPSEKKIVEDSLSGFGYSF